MLSIFRARSFSISPADTSISARSIGVSSGSARRRSSTEPPSSDRTDSHPNMRSAIFTTSGSRAANGDAYEELNVVELHPSDHAIPQARIEAFQRTVRSRLDGDDCGQESDGKEADDPPCGIAQPVPRRIAGER